VLQSWGEQAFRAEQIWQGLYRNFWQTPDEFTNLPKALRERLGRELRFDAVLPTVRLDSSDGQTRKTLFQLQDGRAIEAVLMRYGDPANLGTEPKGEGKRRRTLCISTQAGCAMGCVFCATGQRGFKRHLSSGEIVAQVMYYARLLQEEGQTVTNVVVMGMGEPFHNYENTMQAIDRLTDPMGTILAHGGSPSPRLGWCPPFAASRPKTARNLAVSLHAADDSLQRLDDAGEQPLPHRRSSWMPAGIMSVPRAAGSPSSGR
jgi:23S rRNA (adenine2503-C2)-methyltransferase